jgi:hypothetical protein
MSLVSLHHLLNVSVQLANKRGFKQTKIKENVCGCGCVLMLSLKNQGILNTKTLHMYLQKPEGVHLKRFSYYPFRF